LRAAIPRAAARLRKTAPSWTDTRGRELPAGVMPVQGGLPILHQGECVGGIGVSTGVRAWLEARPTSIATLRCLGARSGLILVRSGVTCRTALLTLSAIAVQQGAQNFRCVRVTDGTDAAAYTVVPGSNASFTAMYTGSLGNNITLTLRAGTKPNTWMLSVLLPGFVPEVFDGLVGNGAAFWTGLAAAVNAGLGPQRGPSLLVVASGGGTTASPAPFSITLGSTSAGADGASQVGTTQLLGSDAPTRSGMYALRGQGCGLAVLADCVRAWRADGNTTSHSYRGGRLRVAEHRRGVRVGVDRPGDDPGHAFPVRAVGGYPALRAHDPGRGDEFHRLRDLLRALDRADPATENSELRCHYRVTSWGRVC